MKNLTVFKTGNDHWSTPESVFKKLNEEFNFNDDPCPLHSSIDGLSRPWGTSVFCNPPYSKLILWAKKAFDESRRGKQVILLVPSRTDTKWWHDYAMKADEIRFIKGRLRFGNAKGPAPFPSCIIIFRGTR